MIKTRQTVVALLTLMIAPLIQAGPSQAGGLPALAAEVAELRALVESLQEQVGEDQGYAGTYHLTLFESGIFGCGEGIVPFQPNFGTYFQNQAVSSAVTRSSTSVAESDGMVIEVPTINTFSQELRLSGSYEEDHNKVDGAFDINIATDGSLSVDAGPDVSVSGQMADDGSSFTIIATGLFDEDGCDDAFTVLGVGVRK